MNDFWLKNVDKAEYDKLSSNIDTTVLVIGGGIAGILAAYKLHMEGLDVVLCEKNKIGHGVSLNTTATITSFLDEMYYQIIKDSKLKRAKAYFDLSNKAISEFKELSEKFNYDFEELSGIKYFNDKDSLTDEFIAIRKIGGNPEFVDKLEIDINSIGGIKLLNQGQCNLMKLIYELSKEIKVYEDTKISELKRNYAVTADGNIINFEYAIIATHYPFKDKFGLYFTKVHQLRSDVFAVKSNNKLNSFYISADDSGMYVREYHGYHLWGGNDRRVGEKRNDDIMIKKLIEDKYETDTSYHWSTQDIMTLDSMPYVGKVSLFYPNIYVSTGFNGYGLVGSMMSAGILTNLVLGIEDEYNEVFKPNRKYLFKSFFNHMGIVLISLLSLGGKRCSHMGCKLHYNHSDKTYECRCHGSRYLKNGKCINEPAQKNIKIKSD